MALLSLQGATKKFGGLTAVDDVTFDVDAGSIISLIGPNGAGKSTVFNLITGIYAPTSGTIVFDGRSIGGLKPHVVASLGILRTFQNIRLFAHMTVLDNVSWGATRGCARRRGTARFARRSRAARRPRPRSPPRHCSIGSGSRDSRPIGRATCRTARSAAWRSRARWRLGAETAAAGRAGRGHQSSREDRLDEARAGDPGPRRHRAAHRTRHEARDGHLRLRPRPGLRRRDRAWEARPSPPRSARHRSVSRQRRMSDALLTLTGVETFYGRIQALRGVTIDVHEGEIVALIGANGAGKTTTLRTISGLMKPARGTIRFRGKDLAPFGADAISRMGVVHSPEGRRIFPRMSVRENLELGAFARNDSAGDPARLGRGARAFPALERAHGATRRHAVRRRAADARDRARADVGAEGAAARRTVDGPIADLRRYDLLRHPGHQQARRHHPAHRAERAKGVAGGLPRLRPRNGRHREVR